MDNVNLRIIYIIVWVKRKFKVFTIMEYTAVLNIVTVNTEQM